MENICNFIPFHKDYNSIHTINFVLETQKQVYTKLKIDSVCKMYYVYSGSGRIHTQGKTAEVFEGDIFFSFPAFPFCIESGNNFTYMYISFLGTRANMIFEKLSINKENFIFKDCERLSGFWRNAISADSFVSDLTSESVLLLSFAYIGSRHASENKKSTQISDITSRIKKYIDDNLSDSELTLEKISKNLNYNQKYISSIFKKNMKIGFSKYLNIARVQYACNMFKQGFTSVTDVSNMCGFSDPMYFSAVFKKTMNMTPSDYKIMYCNK